MSGNGLGSLALIHTVTGLVPTFEDLIQRHLPDWRPFNIVDESLLRNAIRDGRLTEDNARRVAGHIWSAVDAGADAILVTCSSIGPAVDATRSFCPVPLVRVDEETARGDKAGRADRGSCHTFEHPRSDL